ncbi:MAG: HAMP domain-containing sensor histidine kinase [Cyanobacteria bacterium P01_H01_bin.58]
MPASAEFSALCQSQLSLITPVVGADSTAIYLAESWNEQALPQLVPIAVYPTLPPSTRAQSGSYGTIKALPENLDLSHYQRMATGVSAIEYFTDSHQTAVSQPAKLLPSGEIFQAQQSTTQQLVIPLVHEGGVVGILASWRTDHPWQPEERNRLEECAHSLTLACVLDQRGQWAQTRVSALNRLQTQQSDRFHELLHQLRNPLTALKTFGKLLTKRLQPEDNNRSLVSNMLRESDRMQDLLVYFNDTLQAVDEARTETATTVPLLASADDADPVLEAEASPITANSLAHFGGALKIEVCSIPEVIMPLAESIQALAAAANVTFHICAPEQAHLVEADVNALIEIASILLENALKYTQSGRAIWLAWGLHHITDRHLTGVVVGDTGPGIPQADQPRIFERHYRGVQAVSDVKGSGLGLAIAADLAQEMSGLIEVYSPLTEMPYPLPNFLQEWPKKGGTAFILWLPKA